MFWNAALTRALESLSNMGEDDTFKITAIEDLGQIGDKVAKDVKELSPKYGKTREFSIFSHSGLDGPIGSVPATKNALYEKGDLLYQNEIAEKNSNQIDITGWGSIDFNWVDQGAKAYFWGCNTANDIEGSSFTNSLSYLPNYKDVTVFGQQTSSYPSMYTNVRETNAKMRAGEFDFQRTYMVSSDKYWLIGRWTTTSVYQMLGSKNGKVVSKITPKGVRK